MNRCLALNFKAIDLIKVLSSEDAKREDKRQKLIEECEWRIANRKKHTEGYTTKNNGPDRCKVYVETPETGIKYYMYELETVDLNYKIVAEFFGNI